MSELAFLRRDIEITLEITTIFCFLSTSFNFIIRLESNSYENAKFNFPPFSLI